MCQNVNNEALLARFKFQVKIGVCVQREWQKYTCSSPSLSNDEGLKNIGHSMSIRNLIFGVNSVMVSDLILWQFITKCDTCYYKMWQLFYCKKQQKFITKCMEFFITKWDSFITKCNSFIRKCNNFIMKCDDFTTKCNS